MVTLNAVKPRVSASKTYPPVRADNGNDISNENPSLPSGAAGTGGCAPASGARAGAVFVCTPIGRIVTVGARQARRVP
jgi:hypothetical protein